MEIIKGDCIFCNELIEIDETKEATICPNCGKAFITKRVLKKGLRYSILNFIKKNKILTGIIVAFILLLGIGLPLIFNSNDELAGKDLEVYNLILEVSYTFNDPSSVRIISGWIAQDGEKGFFVLSAKNLLGVRKTGKYFIARLDDGQVYAMEEEVSGMTYVKSTGIYKKNEFDIDKVNRALKKYWSELD